MDLIALSLSVSRYFNTIFGYTLTFILRVLHLLQPHLLFLCDLRVVIVEG